MNIKNEYKIIFNKMQHQLNDKHKNNEINQCIESKYL